MRRAVDGLHKLPFSETRNADAQRKTRLIPSTHTPISELALRLEESRFAPLIAELRRELKRARIALVPHFYLSTEYGCVEGTATIGLLWTDGFSRWQRLAKRRGLRTRPPRLILKTLRHEVGHAFCYAHELYKESEFVRLFSVRGDFFKSYPDVWKPSNMDRDRLRRGEVILLYATRHADEDFATCFQAWLEGTAKKPGWQRRFARAPVLIEKIEYVADAVQRCGKRRAPPREPELDEPTSEVQLSVHAWMDSVLAGNNYNLLPDSPVGSHASSCDQALMDHLP